MPERMSRRHWSHRVLPYRMDWLMCSGMMRHQLVATRRTGTKMRPASCTTSGANGAPGEDEEETGDELLTDAGRGWRR